MPSPPLFNAITRSLDGDRVLKIQIKESSQLLTYKNVIESWISNASFSTFFCSMITNTRLPWYVWEMPPITRQKLNDPFECVLVTIPPRPRHPDQHTFANYFDATQNDGIVSFENLGKDALLVVPSPYSNDDDYTELAAFLQNAPSNQKHALWKTLGTCMLERISNRPMWVSIAGGGVAWLHLRLDSYPKYYRHAPYRYVH